MNSQTSPTPSFDDPTLHIFALSGERDSLCRVLDQGANINAVDSKARTVLACAVAGERWESVDVSDAFFMSEKRLSTIKTILEHPGASLFTLNAPNAELKGVTPLGIASWLNSLPAVRLLLEGSVGRVSVNGTDNHGATALMYAARDGSLEIVQHLLANGARADYRDMTSRSSIQHGLDYPQVLWLLESSIRRHRHEELIQTGNRRKLFASSEHHLEQVIASSTLADFDPFHPPPEELFGPSYISAVTHTLCNAVRLLDLDILHALLFVPATAPAATTILPKLVNHPDDNGWSAVHYCCSAEDPSIDILDALWCAGADLSLFTTTGDSVLHCLAAHAVPPAFLIDSALTIYLFILHLVRDLRAPLSARDKEGETCIHVAAERGLSSDVLKALLDCDTIGRTRSLRNNRGLTAFEVCRPEFRKMFGGSDDAEDVERPTSAASMRTIRPTASLASISAQSMSSMASGPIIPTRAILSNFDLNTAIDALTTNLEITSPTRSDPQGMNDPDTLQAALVETRNIGVEILEHLRAQLDSTTETVRETKELLERTDETVKVLTESVTRALEKRGIAMRRERSGSQDSQTTDVEVELEETDPVITAALAGKDFTGWLGAARFKAWFKKKVLHEPAVPTPSRAATPAPTQTREYSRMEVTLRDSYHLLGKSENDLARISASLTTAEEYVGLIGESIVRAQKVLRRTLANREEMAQALRDHQQIAALPDDDTSFFYQDPSASPSSSVPAPGPNPYSPIGSLFSASSSTVSLAMTLTHADDDDIRGLRRLLVRKIQARTDGANQSLDQALAWLKIVREVVVSVKSRAQL